MDDLVDGENYVYSHVDIPAALYIIEVAKLASDTEKYFPRGKWATIQSIQQRIAHALNASIKELKSERQP